MLSLIKKNRSYRRFYEDVLLDKETLEGLVNLARLSPSGGNLQPLKYIISWEEEINSKYSPVYCGRPILGLART